MKQKGRLLIDKLSGKPPEKGKPFTVYGKAGEIVEIISWHDEVAIVQGVKERFSVRKEHLNIIG